ncbi:MAG: hypothetical protein ACTS3R_21360 [Inquilinaceae bacterium]
MSFWALGFLAGAAIVAIVAVLLVGILLQARRIRKLARTASDVVAEIDINTRSVWALRDTNRVAAEILEGAKAIDANAAAVVDAVSHTHTSQDVA